MTPLSRTKALLEADGFLVAITEHWNPWARIRQDLFGFADLLAINPASGTVALVQTTTGDHHAERVRKMQESETAAELGRARGLVISVISWSKRKEGNRSLWKPRIERVRFGNDQEINFNRG